MSNQKPENNHISSISPQVAEYIRLYTEANYPIRDIAKQCQTSVSTVYNAMVSAGFKEFRPRHSRASHTRMSMEQQAIALYQSGMTRTEVAQKVRCNAKTLNSILKSHDIPIRKRIDNVNSASRAAEYNRAYNDYHLTLRETAELFGVSHPIVLRELKRNGYPIRQTVDSKNRIKFRLKHKQGGLIGLPTPKLTPRQKERRQAQIRSRQKQEDKKKLKRLETYALAQEYWQLACEGGLELEQVGDLFGVSGKTVKRVIKGHGIDLKELSRKEKEAAFKEEAEIAKQYWELYKQPMSLEHVGHKFGLSDSTIRNTLLKHGYETRKRGRLLNCEPTPRKPKKAKQAQVVVISAASVVETSAALDLLGTNTKVKPTS